MPASTELMPVTNFQDLGVAPWLVQSLSNMAIQRPTTVQRLCIPEILKGRDCIGTSTTGSGKTCAFAVPILQKLADDACGIFAVVLTPTRELAVQIFEQFQALSSSFIKAALIVGGDDMQRQAIELSKRPHIVIATPGRLADHVRTSTDVRGLQRARFVVFDEADRLLADSAGMLPDIEECLTALPPASQRQMLLFTVTMTPELRALAQMPPKLVKEPHYLHALLHTTTTTNKNHSTIVFCNRTATVNYLHHLLSLLGLRVTALHSKLKQRRRVANLSQFRAQAGLCVLLATDVAARGLDIPYISLVIKYDVPHDPDDYIHRVGRAARAGRKGTAISLVGQRDVSLILAIEERIGRRLEIWQEGLGVEKRVVQDLKLVGEKRCEARSQIRRSRERGV